MANHPLKKLWRNRDNSDCANSFSWDTGMKISSWHSRQNCTQNTSWHCRARSPKALKRPFKYFSFVKQAVPPLETKGNLNDLGFIFFVRWGFGGHGSTFSPRKLPLLNKESDPSESFGVWFPADVAREAFLLVQEGSLCSLPLKSDGLFRRWHAPGWQPWRNQSTEWPFVGREGAFYFSQVFLVHLILVPDDRKSE